LASECNVNPISYAKFGYTFKPPEGILNGSNEADAFLAGASPFKVIDIEIYKVIGDGNS